MTYQDTAPYIGAPGSARYPMGGARTLGAWQAMWDAMRKAGDDWSYGSDLDLVGAAQGPCALGTAKLILHRAAKAGILESRLVLRDHRRQVEYRISKP